MDRKPRAVRSESAPVAARQEPATERRTLREPKNHRTVDRVTRILEEVVYKPGITFAELVRTLDAAKSSVHGFMRGLLAQGWLYESDGRYYLGPAVYSLTLASGHIRAGLVTHDDLAALHEDAGVAVFLGVQAGDHLIYVAETGSDAIADFEARSNIRRSMLETAGGKALLAARPALERQAYLRRRGVADRELVAAFLEECAEIRQTRIAVNVRRRGARFAIGTCVTNPAGDAVASVTLVGATADLQPRLKKLGKLLLQHVDRWSSRQLSPREAI